MLGRPLRVNAGLEFLKIAGLEFPSTVIWFGRPLSPDASQYHFCIPGQKHDYHTTARSPSHRAGRHADRPACKKQQNHQNDDRAAFDGSRGCQQ